MLQFKLTEYSLKAFTKFDPLSVMTWLTLHVGSEKSSIIACIISAILSCVWEAENKHDEKFKIFKNKFYL